MCVSEIHTQGDRHTIKRPQKRSKRFFVDWGGEYDRMGKNAVAFDTACLMA